MLNFESVNCDGKHIKWEFNIPNEVHRLFWSDTCPLPSNDDPIVHAELDGKPLPQCKAFLDLLHMLGLDEEQYPPEKGKTHKLIAIDLDNTLVDYTTAFKDCISQLQKKPLTAPEPTDYGFACEGWFETHAGFREWHHWSVNAGLYLREHMYPHAMEALLKLIGMSEDNRLLFVTSRDDDRDDTRRWMIAMNFDTSQNHNLCPRRNLDDLRHTEGDAVFASDIRRMAEKDWYEKDPITSIGYSYTPSRRDIPYCHLKQKNLLKADLYVEDNPIMLDTLIREGLPVLAKRHGYNVEQCERLEQYDKGASFDSWEEVPELANRILGKE